MPLSKEKQEELDLRREQVAILYAAGFTQAQMDAALGLKPGGTANDVVRLRAEGKLADPPKWSGKAERFKFQFLALAKVSQEPYSAKAARTKQQFRVALDIQSVLEQLEKAADFMMMVADNAERSPEWCVKLIDVIFGYRFSEKQRRCSYSVQFDDYLKEVAESTVPPPYSIESLFETMLVRISVDIRSSLWPDWPDEEHVLSVVNPALATVTPRQEQVLRLRFEQGKTLEETGIEIGITRERTRQIEAKALRKLRHPDRRPLFKPLISQTSLSFERTVGARLALEEQTSSLIELIQRNGDLIVTSKERLTALGVDAETDPEYVALFCETVDDLELSVRSAQCLQNANIKYLYELVEKTDKDLLKGKNFGRKSLNEVKEALAEKGLTLGMDGDHPNMHAAKKACPRDT